MHVPQVRKLGHPRASRRALRARPKHHQREDLRDDVVLVHRAGRDHLTLPHLRPRRHLGAGHEEGHGREERKTRH